MPKNLQRIKITDYTHAVNGYFPPLAQQPLVGHGLLIIEVSRSHSDTPHSVGLLWTSDQLHAETSTWQQTLQSQEKEIYTIGGIRTLNPSKRTAANPRLNRNRRWHEVLTADSRPGTGFDKVLIQRNVFPSCLQSQSVYPTHWYARTALVGVATLRIAYQTTFSGLGSKNVLFNNYNTTNRRVFNIRSLMT